MEKVTVRGWFRRRNRTASDAIGLGGMLGGENGGGDDALPNLVKYGVRSECETCDMDEERWT